MLYSTPFYDSHEELAAEMFLEALRESGAKSPVMISIGDAGLSVKENLRSFQRRTKEFDEGKIDAVNRFLDSLALESDDSLEWYKAATRADPNNLTAWFRVAVDGDFNERFDAIRELCARDPHNALPWYLRAGLEFEYGALGTDSLKTGNRCPTCRMYPIPYPFDIDATYPHDEVFTALEVAGEPITPVALRSWIVAIDNKFFRWGDPLDDQLRNLAHHAIAECKRREDNGETKSATDLLNELHWCGFQLMKMKEADSLHVVTGMGIAAVAGDELKETFTGASDEKSLDRLAQVENVRRAFHGEFMKLIQQLERHGGVDSAEILRGRWDLVDEEMRLLRRALAVSRVHRLEWSADGVVLR